MTILFSVLCVKESIKLLMVLSLLFSGVVRNDSERMAFCTNSPFLLPFFCSSNYRLLIQDVTRKRFRERGNPWVRNPPHLLLHLPQTDRSSIH